MKEWIKERCSEEPQELQLVADGIYIQRKNIKEVQHEATEGMEVYTDWECDSREITVSEYQMLKSIEESAPTRRLMTTPHSLSRRDCYNESINRQSEKTLYRRQADKGTNRSQSGEGNY